VAEARAEIIERFRQHVEDDRWDKSQVEERRIRDKALREDYVARLMDEKAFREEMQTVQ
jgi:hypothetical protein